MSTHTFKISLACSLIALSTALACASQDGATRDESPSTPSASLETWTSGPEGFDTHSYWYDSGDEVVVFDAQFTPALAEALIADIASKTDSPIRYVVITHPNPDKFNGVGPFRALGAEVIASASTAAAIPGVHAYKKYYFVEIAKMFTNESYPAEAVVDRTFSGTLELELAGGEKVELKELDHAGVSSTQTVAHIPSERALIVGDLVHHGTHAWLEGGIVEGKPAPDLAAWRLALSELKAWEGTTVFGGRGASAPVEEAVSAQIAYLNGMETLVRDYIEGLGERRAELLGDEAGQHHQAIAEEAAATFPERGLSYLVGYGVYGLVGALAGEAGE